MGQNDSEMDQNDPKIYQNGTLGISGSPLGGPRVPQEAPRPILDPTGSPNEPKLVENGSRNLSQMKNGKLRFFLFMKLRVLANSAGFRW